VAEVAGPENVPSDGSRASHSLGKSLIWCAIGVLFIAVLVPETWMSLSVAGIGVLCALGAGVLTFMRDQDGAIGPRSELNDLIFHDDRSVFVTAATGEVLTRNAAARKIFGDAGGDVLEQVISKQLPNPSAVILAGSRAKSVDRLFKTTPTHSGEKHSILTQDGEKTVQVIMVEGAGGRTEFFLNPVDENANDPRAIGNFLMLEDFPVALLRMRPDGKIEDANKLARDLLNVSSTQNKLLPDLIGGLGRPILDWLGDAAEGKSLHQPEVMRAREGEEERYLQMSLGRVLQDGEVSLIAMVTDATELKTLEAQFVQSQKMQAIGQLAGGVAHDFNNLLTAISGHCDLLMLRHDPGDMDYGDLEQINQNANRAASLVSQLLAFSRKQNLQLEVLDMRDTLSDLTHLLNRLVGAQISLNLTHDPQLQSVRADRRQLEQVIMNLVVNARDAMDGNGGEISIGDRAWPVHRLRHRQAIGRFHFCGFDTGQGV